MAAIGREAKKAVAADVRFDKSNNVPPRQSCDITVVLVIECTVEGCAVLRFAPEAGGLARRL